jgi:hypothetical protein
LDRQGSDGRLRLKDSFNLFQHSNVFVCFERGLGDDICSFLGVLVTPVEIASLLLVPVAVMTPAAAAQPCVRT